LAINLLTGSKMAAIDFIFLVLIIIPAIYGLFKGIARMVITLLSIFLGFLFASHYSDAVAKFLKDLWEIGRAGDIIAFTLCFFAVLFICAMFGKLVRKGIVGVNLGCLDRLLGAGVGGVLGIAVSFGLIFLIYSYLSVPEHYLGKSRLAPPIVDVSEYLFLLIPSGMEEDMMEEYERLKELWESEKDKGSKVLST
jgi:membrane protein required for colicin V production